MDQRTEEIIAECKRQVEACAYTSTALYSWLKCARVYRVLFITLPIILGAFASAKILVKNPDLDWLTAAAAALAGLFPAIFKALDLDVSIKAMASSAHRFENLRDRFRQASLIWATKPTDELEAEFLRLMEAMEIARSEGLAIPERHFKKAHKKIEDGHYAFQIDARRESLPS